MPRSVPVHRPYLPMLVLAVLASSGCGSKESASVIPERLNDGWEVASPDQSGFDPVSLARLTDSIRAGEFPNTHALVIEHDGRLIYEEYFEGTDERWGEPLGHRLFDRESLHDLRSVSKSVTSAVLGIALGETFEEALQRPIVSFFPGLKTDPGAEKITLHHVLTMTAGLEWNEMTVPYTDENNDEIRLYSVKDPVAMVLARPVVDPPGAAWYYSGGLSQVLAGVVQQRTGRKLDDYASEVLFEPLGITHYEWLGEPSWDPGMPSAASGLRLRARDLAKIGSLYLNGGQWAGRQIIPRGWVQRSMVRHVEQLPEDWNPDGIFGYGYQWWHGRFPRGYTAVAGVGNGNQRVFVLPAEKLVITIFAGEYNKFEGHSEMLLDRIMEARAS